MQSNKRSINDPLYANKFPRITHQTDNNASLNNTDGLNNVASSDPYPMDVMTVDETDKESGNNLITVSRIRTLADVGSIVMFSEANVSSGCITDYMPLYGDVWQISFDTTQHAAKAFELLVNSNFQKTFNFVLLSSELSDTEKVAVFSQNVSIQGGQGARNLLEVERYTVLY